MIVRLSFAVLIFVLTAGIAHAVEEALKKSIQPHFIGNEIQSIKKTPYLGLYEITVGDELFYTDETADYFFFGHVIDGKTRQSLTNTRLQEIMDARRIPLDSLPLDLAIKTVRGTGARKMAVFTDPHCPYCKRLEEQLVDVTDITIYTLLYPVLNGSAQRVTEILCADNPLQTWDDFMLRGIEPNSKDCETPIEALLEVGRKNKVTGTPTLVFADGTFVGGLIPTDNIEERLNDALGNALVK